MTNGGDLDHAFLLTSNIPEHSGDEDLANLSEAAFVSV